MASFVEGLGYCPMSIGCGVLTLWYTTVLAAVMFLPWPSLFATFTLLNAIDRQLEGAANRVTDPRRLRAVLSPLETVLGIPELDVFATPGLYIEVYDVDSGQTVRSKTLGEGSLPLDEE